MPAVVPRHGGRARLRLNSDVIENTLYVRNHYRRCSDSRDSIRFIIMSEVKLGKKHFCDAVIKGGLLGKAVSKSLDLAVDLGVDLARVENVGQLSKKCEEKLRSKLTDFVAHLQWKWNKSGRRTKKNTVLGSRVT